MSDSMAPLRARVQHAAAIAKRRNDEANDALDFLFLGDLDGRHTAKCVHRLAGGDSCSRDYDPMPYRQTVGWTDGVPAVISAREKALPAGEEMYEGTGIGALYGIEGSERHFWTLAGWNIKRRRAA